MKVLKKLLKFARELWLMLGIAILMLTVIELALSFGFYVRGFWHSPDPNYKLKADTFAGASWVSQYYKEFDALGLAPWKPYVYWGRKPHRGETININEEGIRKTYCNPAAAGSTEAVKVFMFGGSTMWGAGARDDFTIPSYFAKETQHRGLLSKVTNLGQSGYVSTQEVIELLLQLQKGNIPDAVIFYDGVNDAFAAFQSGVAGLPQNEFNREQEFNLLKREEFKGLALQESVKKLNTLRFLNGVLDRAGVSKPGTSFPRLACATPIADKEALADAMATNYLNNLKLVKALSEAYGFKCLFYWQPVIYQKQHLTDYERWAIQLEHNYKGMKEFYLAAYSSLQKHAATLDGSYAFHDISSIFDQVREPVYIDYCHMSERGNSEIARLMAEDFARLMR